MCVCLFCALRYINQCLNLCSYPRLIIFLCLLAPAVDFQPLHVASRAERTGACTLVLNRGAELCTLRPTANVNRCVFQISGGLYHSNILWLQKLLFVPIAVSRIGRHILEPLFSSESKLLIITYANPVQTLPQC